jgi:hypothetical protein
MSNTDEGTARRARIAEAIAAHRQSGSESPVLFVASGPDPPFVEYRDREITVTTGDRDRLEVLLGEFPVFKIAQPATNKAPEGEVHLSALADPKHTADFVDRLFLDVFGVGDDYTLRVEEA